MLMHLTVVVVVVVVIVGFDKVDGLRGWTRQVGELLLQQMQIAAQERYDERPERKVGGLLEARMKVLDTYLGILNIRHTVETTTKMLHKLL